MSVYNENIFRALYEWEYATQYSSQFLFYENNTTEYKILFKFDSLTVEDFKKFCTDNNLPEDTDRRPVAETSGSKVSNDTKATIRIFTNINWNNSDPTLGRSYDFKVAMMHEIGHALGLGHINKENALMYCCYENQKNISDIDLNKLNSLYNFNSECKEVQQGLWDFELYSRGVLLYGFSEGDLVQNDCYITYSVGLDKDFWGMLVDDVWTGKILGKNHDYDFSGIFIGEPPISFEGTWGDNNYKMIGTFVGN